MLTAELNDPISLPTVVTIMKRHANIDGLCRCCGQPWPCDVRILSGILIRRPA